MLENIVLQRQTVYRLVEQLKAQNFFPDSIYNYSGWEVALFI
ncbi:MAG: hypothetical protein JJP05_05845 [cyanobacterium endosymbiont of Rhopalodia gibba]